MLTFQDVCNVLLQWIHGLLRLSFLVRFESVVATVIGTLVAWKIVPLHSLGNDGWKIIAALMSRHIGGGKIIIPPLGF